MLRHIGKLVRFTLADGGKLVAGSLSLLLYFTNKVEMNDSCFKGFLVQSCCPCSLPKHRLLQGELYRKNSIREFP